MSIRWLLLLQASQTPRVRGVVQTLGAKKPLYMSWHEAGAPSQWKFSICSLLRGSGLWTSILLLRL